MANEGILTRLALMGCITVLATPSWAARVTPPDDLKAFMAQVETASVLADPYERCLRMPDPPGSHWTPTAVAAYCRFANEATLNARQFRDLIAAGKGAMVDKLFAGYLTAQLHDPAHPAQLDAAIRRTGWRTSSQTTRRVIDEWMRQRPKSAFAVAASAIQYGAAALDARGSDFASHTSRRQFDGMETLAARARQDFDRAATMKPAIPTLYAYRYSAGVLQGDAAYADAAVNDGLALQSNEFLLRLIRANMSGAKWYGTTDEVARQGDEARALAGRTPLLTIVSSRAMLAVLTAEMTQAPVGDEVAAVAEVAHTDDLSNLAGFAWTAGHNDRALILAVEALRFDAGNDRALYQVAKIAPTYGYGPWMRATLLAAANDHPESVDVARMAGGYLSLYDDFAHSEPLLKSVLAERSYDVWATDQLAALYVREGHHSNEALRLVEALLEHHPEDGWAQVIRARLLISADDPRRYEAIKRFLVQFAQDDRFRDEVNELATYLREHPEATAASGTATEAPSLG
jgi:hypothetical protein